MNGKVEKSINNIIFGCISRICTTFLPFFIRSLFIKKIGLECLGLSNLCTSILGFLNLADLGFSGVIVYFMYKPAEENNYDELSSLLNYFRRVYVVVGLSILAFGLGLMPFLPKLIKGTTPANINIYLIYLTYLINTALSYFFFSYKSSIVTVYQRVDIESKLLIFTNILIFIIQLCILLFAANFYVFVLVLPITTFILNILRSIIVDKLFPEIKPKGKITKEKKAEIRKKVMATFFFRINTVVLKMADNIVISAFLGLVVLANYNNYFIIMTGIMGFVDVIKNSIRPGMGNSVVVHDMEKNYRDLKFLQFLFFIILSFCGSCFLCMYQPFIKCWLGEEYLLPFSTVIFLVLYFYAFYFCGPVNLYKDANGFWTQDSYRPMIEAPFNLVLNIILVNLIGLNGVLISTIITFVFISYPVIYLVMNKFYFKGKIKEYTWKTILYFTLSCVLNILCYTLVSFIKINGILGLFVIFLIITLVTFIFIYLIFKRTEEFKKLVSYKERILKKEKKK